MTRFVELTQMDSKPKLNFSGLVSESPFALHKHGESSAVVPSRVLICVATWSLPDMQMLDSLQEKLTQMSLREEQVEVLDVDTFTSMGDFENRIPGIGPVYHTPVVGGWRHGVLAEKASGATARKLICERYRLTC
jgi:hypothetical protein